MRIHASQDPFSGETLGWQGAGCATCRSSPASPGQRLLVLPKSPGNLTPQTSAGTFSLLLLCHADSFHSDWEDKDCRTKLAC